MDRARIGTSETAGSLARLVGGRGHDCLVVVANVLLECPQITSCLRIMLRFGCQAIEAGARESIRRLLIEMASQPKATPARRLWAGFCSDASEIKFRLNALLKTSRFDFRTMPLWLVASEFSWSPFVHACQRGRGRQFHGVAAIPFTRP